MEKMSIGKAIAEARYEKGLSQSELARALGVTPQAVQKWESGGGPRNTRLQEIANILGVSVSSLLGDQVAKSQLTDQPFGPAIQTPLRPVRAIDNPDEAEHELLHVPRYTLRASAGTGEPVLDIDQHGEPNYMRRSWAKRRGLDPDNLFSIVAVGNSMEPEIHDGDSLIVHRQPNIESDKLMVICFRGECYVKRVLRQFDGSLIVKSTNPDYRDVVIGPEQAEELHVVGRVVSITHNA